MATAWVPTSSQGQGGTVTSVASADTSIAVTNPTTTPSLQLAALNVLATNEPPAAAVPLNAKKITGLADGTVATDAAAFGQIPTALPPSGSAGGDLTGTYPNPTIGSGKVTTAKLAAAVTLDAIAAANATAASVAMNTQKLTGLAAGTTAGDSLRYEQAATSAQPGGWSGTFDLVSSSALTNIFSQSIPANTMGANGAIIGVVEGFYLNNSGASRGLSLGVQFGATNLWFDASNATAFGASATQYSFYMEFLIANEGATNAQRVAGVASFGVATAGSTAGSGSFTGGGFYAVVPFTGTSAIDTTSAANLIVRAQHSASNGSLELKGSVHYRVVA